MHCSEIGSYNAFLLAIVLAGYAYFQLTGNSRFGLLQSGNLGRTRIVNLA